MDRMAIGRRLAKLRGNKTQRDVAKAVGISVSALTMYECGRRIPRDEIKVRLAKFYGTSICSLFFSQEDTISDDITELTTQSKQGRAKE